MRAGWSVRLLRCAVVMGLVLIGLAAGAATDGSAPGSLAWRIGERVGDQGQPIGTLALLIDGRPVTIRRDRPVSYAQIEPGAWSVPAGADLAALGWWAGSGEVVYVIRRAGQVDVYLGLVEEESAGPEFSLIRRLDLE